MVPPGTALPPAWIVLVPGVAVPPLVGTGDAGSTSSPGTPSARAWVAEIVAKPESGVGDLAVGL